MSAPSFPVDPVPCRICGAAVMLLTQRCVGCKRKWLGPQPGPQEKFLACSTDIALTGGGANSGKSFILLLDALVNSGNPLWNGILFRRHAKDFKDKGSIYEKAKRMFAGTGATPRAGQYMDISWPSGASLSFRHLDGANMIDYQGQEYAWIGFDEVTHFEMSWIRYLITRLRTSSGVRPAVRMTCNPDADHEIASWVEPYLNEDGTANRDLSGKPMFWAISVETDGMVWGDSRAACAERAGRAPHEVKSFTFIPALLDDNVIGMVENPDYASSLAVAGRVEEQRLRYGNWKVRAETGGMLRREWWGPVLTEPLAEIVRLVRGWDKAATRPNAKNEDPDFTIGLLIAWDIFGRWYIADMVACRAEPPEVDELMEATAKRDGASVTQVIQVDPGSAGKSDDVNTRKVLGRSGVCGPIRSLTISKNKIVRVQPVSDELRIGMTGKSGERAPRGFILNTGWMKMPYGDGGPASPTLGDLFWRQVARFYNPDEHDDVPDAMAAAHLVGSRPQAPPPEDDDPLARLMRLS